MAVGGPGRAGLEPAHPWKEAEGAGEAPPFYRQPPRCWAERPCFCPLRPGVLLVRSAARSWRAGVPRVEWIRTRLGMLSRGVIQRASNSFGSAVTAVTAAKP